MAIYAISDFHLSFGVKDKPMNVFGDMWKNHEEKLKDSWLSMISETDSVIMSGDFSWATYLEDSKADFEFLNSLPGKKYILKGNHDYWWTTVKKMDDFLKQNDFYNIHFLYNNAYEIEDYLLAGTKYWSYDELEDNDKIFNRELIRAKISLDKAISLNKDKPIIFTTHYPPDTFIIDNLRDYPIKYWLYGHIHTNYEENLIKIPGITTYLTSCDYLSFKPIKLN